MSEYKCYATGKLKLKCSDGIKKKKKDKNKDKKLLELVRKSVPEVAQKSEESHLTEAEKAFLKQQEKLEKERILKKASMTHKQRVEEFNRHLDSLTEHFDIPKVSWTK